MPSERQRVEYEPVRPAGRAGRTRADEDDNFGPPRTGAHGDLAAKLAASDDASVVRSANFHPENSNAEASSATGSTGGGPAGDEPTGVRPSSTARVKEKAREVWSHKRGHGLTYAALFLFTCTLFFRPYEFLPLPTSIAYWFGVVTLAIFIPSQLACDGTFTARPREVVLALLFVGFALLSIPLATNRAEAIAAFTEPFLKAVLIFVIMVNVVRTERRWRWLVWLTMAVSFYLSVGALNDYRHGRFAVEGYRVAGSIGGMFSGSNELGLHLVTVLPIAIGLLWGERGPLKKLIYGAGALLMTAAIVVTFSRGAFLGLVASVGMLLWKLGRRHRFGVAALVVVALVAFLALAPGEYSVRVLSIFDSSLDPNASSSMRQQVFWRSLYVTMYNPVFGVGIGNFHIMSIRDLVSHNAYTQVSSEMGLAALVVYVLFLVTPLRRLRRVERETFDARRSSHFYYRAIALQASLAGYMVSSFFASVAYQWNVYYLVAYAVTLRRLYAAELDAEAAAANNTNPNANDAVTADPSAPDVDGRRGFDADERAAGARLPAALVR